MIVFQSNVINVKKKTLTRYVSAARSFDWGRAKRQITRNDVINSFRKEGLFMGRRYRRMEYQKQERGLACTRNFAKRKGLNPKGKKVSKRV